VDNWQFGDSGKPLLSFRRIKLALGSDKYSKQIAMTLSIKLNDVMNGYYVTLPKFPQVVIVYVRFITMFSDYLSADIQME